MVDKPKRRMTSLTPVELTKAAEMRLVGAQFKDIAPQFGIGETKLRRLLFEHPALLGSRYAVRQWNEKVRRERPVNSPILDDEQERNVLLRANAKFLAALVAAGHKHGCGELNFRRDSEAVTFISRPAFPYSTVGSPAASCVNF